MLPLWGGYETLSYLNSCRFKEVAGIQGSGWLEQGSSTGRGNLGWMTLLELDYLTTDKSQMILTMKIKVQALIIWPLKLCYDFLKRSSCSKDSELNLLRLWKGLHCQADMDSACQDIPKGLKRDWVALYLHWIYFMHQVSVAASGKQEGFIPPSPFFVFWWAYGICLGSVLAFLWSIADQLSWGTGCRKIQWYTQRSTCPSLDEGWNWWMNSWERNKVCWIYLDNINMFYFFR